MSNYFFLSLSNTIFFKGQAPSSGGDAGPSAGGRGSRRGGGRILPEQTTVLRTKPTNVTSKKGKLGP